MKHSLSYAKLHLVHVRFDRMSATDASARLKRMPTDLQPENRDADLIIEFTKTTLMELPEYQGLLNDLGLQGD